MPDSIAVTTRTFEQEVENSELPVLIDFYAQWCGPCKSMVPVVDDYARAVAGKVKVVKIDCDYDSEIGEKFEVSSIPCMVIYHKGRELGRRLGSCSLDDLQRWTSGILV